MVVTIGTNNTEEKRQDREIASLEKHKIGLEEAAIPKRSLQRVVPVIYYLSMNGQLEHPHFMEVPLSCSQGLYLNDVISRLSYLRGKGIATLYSWSSKRSYRNRFVWEDLTEDDIIQPCQGHDYILKGSKLLESSLSFRSYNETVSSSSSSSKTSIISGETKDSSNCEDSIKSSPIIIRRKNQSWSSHDDLRQYQVYKNITTGDLVGKVNNVSTQTDDQATNKDHAGNGCSAVNLSTEHSSFDGLQSLVESVVVNGSAVMNDQTVDNDRAWVRSKPSTALMQLIKCGSRKVKTQKLRIN